MTNFSNQLKIKDWIKSRSVEMGFLDCRMAKAQKLDKEAKDLEKWLNAGHQGTMSYLERNFDLRIDPTKLVPGAKTVIVLSYNYFPKKELDSNEFKLSRYAYGADYHKVIKKKLKQLYFELRENFGQIEGRFFVDSAPILERDWARLSGLGWTGKNTLTLTKGTGSYFFLAELVIDIALPPDSPVGDHCGSCTKCIDSCPTEAINPSGQFLEAEKCISYLTIEYKDKIPDEFFESLEGWMYGCDICQEVCPWNRFSKPTSESKFYPSEELQKMSDQNWRELDENAFSSLFRGSAVKRAGYTKLKSTISTIDQNSRQKP